MAGDKRLPATPEALEAQQFLALVMMTSFDPGEGPEKRWEKSPLRPLIRKKVRAV
jgi:hypothetical protein